MTSRRLDSFARAAMLGLLAATQSACGDDSQSDLEGTGGAGAASNNGDGDSNEIAASGGTGASTSGGGTGGGTATGGTTSNGSGGALGSAGEGGVGGAGVEGVLSSKVIPDLSLEAFTVLCDEAGGVVETHAHCGGVVTGPGFSYDSDTDVFTEHTCAGHNTCTGFSCVIDD